MFRAWLNRWGNCLGRRGNKSKGYYETTQRLPARGRGKVEGTGRRGKEGGKGGSARKKAGENKPSIKEDSGKGGLGAWFSDF